MKIKNTMTGEKEEFKPLDPKGKKVLMYVCGPTVYDRGHLGHGRSAVCFDVIRKYLIYKGYDVTFVSNYTDIDDKMINRAREEEISVSELAEKIIPTYKEDYAELGVMPPDFAPRATEYINVGKHSKGKDMIEFLKKMEKAGVTYVIPGDGVYFDVTKAKNYGKLSKQKLDELNVGARVSENVNKRNPYDFAVWKFAKDDEPDDVKWDSPWGKGRPGWHLECSVMSWNLLGEKFDIHGGGADLMFPHHECEIAQSKSVFGSGAFAKYWIHNGFITINKEKMSKSLGNFFTIRDVLNMEDSPGVKKYSGQVIRYMFLQTHYANPIEFSEELLSQAKAGLERIHGFVRHLRDDYDSLEEGDDDPLKQSENFNFTLKDFEKFMDDDFNTSGAFGALFYLIAIVNALKSSYQLTRKDVVKTEEILNKMDSVFRIIFCKKENIDSEIKTLIKEREQARKEKNFKRADEIRKELLEKGIELEDTANGTVWKKI